MILYVDTSALLKRYIFEIGSPEFATLIVQADTVGTTLITRAEIAAALAKAVRTKALTSDEAATALKSFRVQWNDLAHVQVTETLVAKAESLAWDYGLRGYDALHLAAALVWQESLDRVILLATFDRQLWETSQKAGLTVWPDAL